MSILCGKVLMGRREYLFERRKTHLGAEGHYWERKDSFGTDGYFGEEKDSFCGT